MNIMANLLAQIIGYEDHVPQGHVSRSHVPNAIAKIYRQSVVKGAIPSAQTLLRLLKEEISKFDRLFIVIDALDAWSSYPRVTDRDELLGALVELLPQVNILCFSRTDHGIKRRFSAEFELEFCAKESDLGIYIEGRLCSCEGFVAARRASDLSLDLITTTIIEKAQGM